MKKNVPTIFLIIFVLIILSIFIAPLLYNCITQPKNETDEKFRDEVANQFSDYTTWVGKIEEGYVYINSIKDGQYAAAEEINMIYTAKNKEHYYWIGLSGAYDAINKEFGIQVGDYTNDSFGTHYNVTLNGEELYFKLVKTDDEEFPEQLKEITFQKEKDGYILAAQNYLLKNIKEGYIKQIKYMKTKKNDSEATVQVTGVYTKDVESDYDEKESDYDTTFVAEYENEQYKVYPVQKE